MTGVTNAVVYAILLDDAYKRTTGVNQKEGISMKISSNNKMDF